MFFIPKPFLILLIISIIFLLFLILRLPSISYQTNNNNCQQHLWTSSENNNLNNFSHPINCFIDGKQKIIPCIQQNDLKEVFIPFNSFLKKQFDLFGETDKKNNSFEYFTSNIPLRNKNKNNIGGPIEQFNNVAIRPRIKCLKPENGFPMSIQWNKIPYFYPVQILQFGFDYFTRNRTEKRKLVERRLSEGKNLLLNLSNGEQVNFGLFPDLPILLFSAKLLSSEAFFEIIFVGKNEQKLYLKFRQWPNDQGRCVWHLNINEEGNLSFAYSLEENRKNSNFIEFLLDLPIFVLKALNLLKNSKYSYINSSIFSPKFIKFSGPLQLKIDTFRQKNFAHNEMFVFLIFFLKLFFSFMRVAEWLLKSQDERGGWPVQVERIFTNNKEEDHKFVLSSGWYSAMIQGHALSFLSRAFNTTGDKRFLLAGERACALFELPSTQGGIKNQLFGYDWYEEYPTIPTGTFVLNGFIYSLIGLNDFSQFSNFSKNLFVIGLKSLRSLSPLFDTGQRSLYDLRHVQIINGNNIRPNIARWDYHSLHILLFDYLYLITGDVLFKKISKRWLDYAHGLQIKHN